MARIFEVKWSRLLRRALGASAVVGALAPISLAPEAASAAVDHVVVNAYNGTVAGTLTPNASYTVTLTQGGTVKATSAGTADATGSYVAHVAYDAGHGPGIHNGDVVTVTSGVTTYRQPVQLMGYLDEVTGLFSGTARPLATLSTALYTNGDMAHQVWSGTIVADSGGHFSFDFSSVVHPVAVAGRPAWRGYEALVNARDIPGQQTFRQIQTPNTTLTGTRNQAGGGYLLAGDNVTFQLLRGSTVAATASTTADADGIPQATLAADVGPGDVLSTTYHDAAGHTRTQTLDPWNLTVTIDPSANTVSGATAASAPVEAQYFGPQGMQAVIGQADASGHYSLSFAGKGPFVGNNMVIVFRVAEPGFTGVGVQQVEGRTPVVGLQDVLGKVSGYGTPGVNPVQVSVLRGQTVVATASGTTAKDGGFSGLGLSGEVIAGDHVAVVTGSQALPVYTVGNFTAFATHSASGWTYSGTGAASRNVTIAIGICTAAATVDATGHWTAAVPCALNGNEYGQATETATRASDGAAAGSAVYRFVNVSGPEVEVTSPGPAASVPTSLTITVNAFDHVANSAASKVWLQIDSTWLQATLTSGSTFGLSVTLNAGNHMVIAYAYPAAGTLDANGKPVYSQTPARSFSTH